MPPPNETKRKQGSFLILFLLAVGFAKPCLARDIGEVFHNTTDGSAPPLPSSPPAPSAAEETTSPSPTDGDGGEGMMNSAEMPTSAAVAPPLLDDLDADGDEADAASKAGDQQGTEQISPQEGGEELVFVIHGFPKCRHCDDAQLAKRSDDSLLNDTRFNTTPRGFVELTEERVFDQRTGALMSTTGDYGRPLYNDTQTFRFTVDVAKGYKEIFYLTYWLKVYLDKVYDVLEEAKANYKLMLFRGDPDELTKRVSLDMLEDLLIYAFTFGEGHYPLAPRYYNVNQHQRRNSIFPNIMAEGTVTEPTDIPGGIFINEFNSQYDALVKAKSAKSILDGLVKLAGAEEELRIKGIGVGGKAVRRGR